MWLAFKGIIPPKEWYHNPEIKNSYNDTVAILLAGNKIIPLHEWYHSPVL